MKYPLFVANWKMNVLQEATEEYFRAFRSSFEPRKDGRTDTVFCPPFTTLTAVRDALRLTRGCALGSQNIHWLESGPHTGEISAPMLLECGVAYSIIGHSERRQIYGEHNEFVAKRAKAALHHGIVPIVCIGEATFFENEYEETFAIVKDQIHRSLATITEEDAKNLVMAYEPIWAIGTGRAATPEIVKRLHNFIRSELVSLYDELGDRIPILYGGSTTPENIEGIMSQNNVNGVLVGSTSLKPDSFAQLIKNGREAQGVAS